MDLTPGEQLTRPAGRQPAMLKISLALQMSALTALGVEFGVVRWLQMHDPSRSDAVFGLFAGAMLVGLVCGVLVANDAPRRAYWGLLGAMGGGVGSVILQALVRYGLPR